jgi:hypothetical protein
MDQEKKNEMFDLFKLKVCMRENQIDPSSELDWYSLSLGFFLALDITPDEAHELSREARYNHHYWLDI